MKPVVQISRLVLFGMVVAAYAITGGTVIFFSRDIWRRRLRLGAVIGFYSRMTVALLGLRTSAQGATRLGRLSTAENFLIVANHLTYLDVILLAARHPVSFVTSVEIRNTPFLGQLSLLGGCLYVERRNRDRLHQEVEEVTDGLKRGMNVCVFPEATSTNGDSVLRFRRPLFQAAIDARCRVLPVTINYKALDGEPLSAQNRDHVAWYGEMDFLPHLWRLMGVRETEVDLVYGEPIQARDFSAPQDLAQAAHTAVADAFISLASPLRQECLLEELATPVSPTGA